MKLRNRCPDRKDPLVSLVCLDYMAHRVIRVILVCRVPKDPLDRLVR